MIRRSVVTLIVLIGYVAHGRAMDFRVLAAVGKAASVTSAHWLLYHYTNDNVGMLEHYMIKNGLTYESCKNARKLYPLETRKAYAARMLTRCDGTEICENRTSRVTQQLFSHRELFACRKLHDHDQAHCIADGLRREFYLGSGDLTSEWIFFHEREFFLQSAPSFDQRIETMKILLHDKHLGATAIAQLCGMMFRDEKDKTREEYRQLQEQIACYGPGKIPKTDAECRAAYDRQAF